MTNIGKVEELPPGTATVTSVQGKEVALFNVEGTLYAVGNRCPHRSGPLSRGKVETVPDPATGSDVLAVRCPIHGWLFELATGRCLTRPGAAVPSFELECQEGQLKLGCQRSEAAGPTLSGQVP